MSPDRRQTLQSALLTFLIAALLLAVWHLATAPRGVPAAGAALALTAEQLEYARLMGKDAAAPVKSTGFPTLGQMGETVLKNLSQPFYDNGPTTRASASSWPIRWAASAWASRSRRWWRSRWAS